MSTGAQDAYYFGCWARPGHRYHLPGGRSAGLDVPPWGARIDGRNTYPEGAEGVARLHHRDGWTALGFADRSVDSRGGSHSTFVLKGTLAYDEALAVAREKFPEVFARFDFDVTPEAPVTSPVSSLEHCPATQEER